MPTTLPSTSGIIPYDVPTPGGDVDLWDVGINSSSLTQISQDIYGLRENSYLSIRGGGKISWNASNQVSWTEDIVIRDHVTNNTTTIQASGSPITLSAQNMVAYIAKVREPASNQTPTFTIVAAGSLTKAIGDNNFLVLFMRTGDDTLYVPWLQRELLVSDHWQFGSVLSWYERLASSRKPSYRNDNATADNVDVPASASAPAVVFIDGKIYANTADQNCDMSTAGRNGLDTGSIAVDTAYYLYAITPVSGRGFDLVFSITPPTTGPTGFSEWSYIGAVATDESAASMHPFRASRGEYVGNEEIGIGDNGAASRVSVSFPSIPVTAYSVYLQILVTGTSVGNGGFVAGVDENHDCLATTLFSSVATSFAHGWVPMITDNTLWIDNANALNNLSVQFQGFKEDPMEFQ